MPIIGLLNGVGNLLDNVGDAVEKLVNPLLPGVGGATDNVVDAVADLIRGASGSSGTGGLPLVSNLLGNGLLGGSGSGQSILGLGLLNDEGVVVLDILGTNIAVLPNNGGIVSINGDGLLGNSGLLDLGGLLGQGGLLDLGGLLGPDGIIDLSGILGSVLGLLSPDGTLDPGDYLDEDGNVDMSKFEKVVTGTDGRDTFSLSQDISTYVDGRGDIDWVNFGRSSEGMALAVGSNAVVFLDGNTPYYFENVERVQFFEGALYLDTGAGENAGVAYRLYQATFNRTPDNDGVKWWVNELDKGMSAHQAATGFVHSNEFKSTYGQLTDQGFVSEIYENVLGRAAESAGLSYWLNQLSSGQMDRAEVLIGFSESAENVALVGQVIEHGYALA